MKKKHLPSTPLFGFNILIFQSVSQTFPGDFCSSCNLLLLRNVFKVLWMGRWMGYGSPPKSIHVTRWFPQDVSFMFSQNTMERNRNKKLVNLQVCSVATLLFRFACFCNWKIGKLDLNNGKNLVKPTPNGWMILCILNKSIYYSVHLSSMKMRGSIGYHYLYMLQYLAFCGIPGFEIPAFGTRSRASGEESPFDWPPPGPSSTSWRQACCTINTGSCQSAFLDKVRRKQNRSGQSWGDK